MELLWVKERSEDSKMLEKFEIYETLENEKLEIKETVTADGVKKKITGGDKTFSRYAYPDQEFISLLTRMKCFWDLDRMKEESGIFVTPRCTYIRQTVRLESRC